MYITQITIYLFTHSCSSGVISDATGSYKMAYWMCISMMAGGAVLFEMEPLMTRIMTNRRKEQNNFSNNKIDNSLSEIEMKDSVCVR